MTNRNVPGHHRLDWDLRTGDASRERVRVSAGRQHLGAAANHDAAPTATDTMQNTRIDTLERAVRELSEDLAHNRKTFVSMIEELRDARLSGGSGQSLYVGNGYGSAMPKAEAFDLDEDHLIGRLHLIEQSVDAKFAELARTWAVLGRRLDALEDGLAAHPIQDATRLTPELAEKIAALPERLVARDEKLSVANAAGLSERLGAMERRILSSTASRTGVPADLPGRLDRIESAFGALLAKLDTLEENRGAVGDGPFDVAPLAAGLKEIEARTGDTQLMIDTVDDRLRKVEDLLDAQRSQLSQVSSVVGSELKSLTATIGAQSFGGEPVGALIEDGMRSVAESMERYKGEISEVIGRGIAERLSVLENEVKSHKVEHGVMLASLSQPLGAGGLVLGMAESYQRDAGAMHDALRTINTNQQRLAASMDQWHAESRRQSANLIDRLSALEAQSRAVEMEPRPVELVGMDLQPVENAETGQQDISLWSRFRVWLYGTNDWFSASWGERRGVRG